jgi:DNA (cytosine-5)-methyltransferase 1
MLPRIDIIFGGFPCQDISVAGLGKGLEGDRSGLFFEIVRLARECEPRFIFLENVPAIRTRGGERVVKELASIGYDCRWTTLSAAAVGAPHKRERWFLLAHANGLRRSMLGDAGKMEETSGRKEETGDQYSISTTSCGSNVAHAPRRANTRTAVRLEARAKST